MPSRLGLAVVLMICTSASVQAQIYQPQPSRQQKQQMQQLQQMQQTQPMEIQGVLEGMTRGRIMLLDENNQTWQVAIPMTAEVHVTGTADADCLRTGMIVEFTAEIDDRGVLKEKVGELSIISPSPDKQMGLFPVESTDKQDDMIGEVKEDRAEKKAKSTKRSSGKGTAAIPAGSYRIVGRLMVARNGKLSVHVGRGMLPLELTEQPAITLNISDYSVASKGDKVSVKGMMMTTRPGMAQATTVAIELAQPLAGATKKGPPAKLEGKHPAKRPEKEQGLPELPAEK